MRRASRGRSRLFLRTRRRQPRRGYYERRAARNPWRMPERPLPVYEIPSSEPEPMKGKPKTKAAGEFPPEVRFLIAQRAGGLCEGCGWGPDFRGFRMHHRLPRRSGGTLLEKVTTAANGMMICGICDDKIENTGRAEARRKGLVLSERADPAEERVLYRGRTWVLLNTDGTLDQVVDVD